MSQEAYGGPFLPPNGSRSKEERETELRTQLVYGATPSRLAQRKEEIMQYVAANNKACLHPFNALPHEYFEGGGVDRETTLAMCCRLIDACDEFWVFGISEGTLVEATYFFEQNDLREIPKPFRVLVSEFDPDWQETCQIYAGRFGEALLRLGLQSQPS